MAEVKMYNVREKLSKIREMCDGMPKEVLALTDYMAEVANETLVPNGMVMLLGMCLYDIEKGKASTGKNLPEYLVTHKKQVLDMAVYIPQVIDAIADKDFAEEFRTSCKEIFDFDPPKRVSADIEGEYPEYVKVAVEWWANAVLAPKLGDIPNSLATMVANFGKQYSKEEISFFKTTLAEEILKIMEKRHRCELSVDYHPCKSLEMAGDKIGIDSMMGYPWKTRMKISEDMVSVSAGEGAPSEILWQRKSSREEGE